MGQPHTAGRISPGTVVGIVLVSIWMVVALLLAFFLGAGDAHVCASSDSACIDRYGGSWAVMLGVVAASILITIVLWALPRARAWGFVTGLLGTGGAVIGFVALYDVPL